MGKLLPVMLAALGLAAGGVAGYVFRPSADEVVAINPCGDAEHTEDAPLAAVAEPPGDGEHSEFDYVKLNNQFVVPIVEDDDVAALVILSISLQVAAGSREDVYALEPKIRDLFLQVLFDHANAGGFRGAFTQSSTMAVLRNSLREAARKTMGSVVADVLIVDIVRQDS